MDYEDLVIQLGTGAGGYTVQVSRAPAGETDPEPLDLAVEAAEIEGLARIFANATRDLGQLSAAEVAAPALIALGDRLFRSLLPGEVRRCYDRCLGRLEARPDCGLRIRIQMGLGVPAMLPLHAVPWEFLYDARTRHFLALDSQTSIVRHLDLAMPGDRPPVRRPLSILVVACLDPALDLERERQAIEQAWSGQRKVHFHLLADPTLQEVRDELVARDYHVLHFMGHGGFDPAAGEGSLAFRDGGGQRAWVSGQQIADQVRDRSSLRLVVLNACWTARTSSSGPYAGVATALLNAGVPAVLAMQFPITDAAALAFSKTFYRRLARGDTLDAAVANGRLAIHGDEHHRPEWGTPVLFERLTGGRIVESRAAPEPRGRGRGAAAALLAAGGLLAAWLGLRAYLASPSSPGAPVSAPAAHAFGQRPIAAPGSRFYVLRGGQAVLLPELATAVAAEFTRTGRERSLTLDVTPPNSPALHRLVQGGTLIDLQPGAGRLVVLRVDWSGETLTLNAEPRGPPPGGVSAQCGDGLYSFSRSRGGTCSGHSGVARWL
jgi:hypothetical protein